MWLSKWKSKPKKKQIVPRAAYTLPVAAPTLVAPEGRVVVKFATSSNPGENIQTTGRLNRGRIESAYIFEETQRLGSGASGFVRLAVYRYTGTRVAVKTFIKSRSSKERIHVLRNEAQILLKLDHPYIVRLIEVWEDEDAVHFVMEHCDGGMIGDHLAVQKHKRLDETTCRLILQQITTAIQYLHSHNIVHRDIKLDHCLVDGLMTYEISKHTTTGGAAPMRRLGKMVSVCDSHSYSSIMSNNELTTTTSVPPHSGRGTARYKFVPYVKIVDFGFSRVWSSQTSRPMKATCGSLPFVAPEVLLGHYTSKCDLWSLGILTYCLLTGSPPFYGSELQILNGVLYQNIDLDRIRKQFSLSRTCVDFLRKLLNRDPNTRISAKEAVMHPWICGITSPMEINPKVKLNLFMAFAAYARSPYLRKTILVMMAYCYSTSASKEVSFVREVFLTLDVSCQGSVSLQDMAEFLLSANSSVTFNQVESIIEGMNAFDRGEFFFNDILAASFGFLVPFEEHILRTTFWKFDKRRTGLITVDNIRDLLGSVFRDKALEQMLREADRDGDKFIDCDEFRRIAMDVPKLEF